MFYIYLFKDSFFFSAYIIGIISLYVSSKRDNSNIWSYTDNILFYSVSLFFINAFLFINYSSKKIKNK